MTRHTPAAVPPFTRTGVPVGHGLVAPLPFLGVPLIFHWGGDRHGQAAEVPEDVLVSGLLVYDGLDGWIGVYEPSDPPQKRATERGLAEVWVVRE